MSAELWPHKYADGWTVARLASAATPVQPDETWYVVYLKDRQITRVFGAGSQQESESVAAALDAVERVNLTPGDPGSRGIILKALRTTLDLARQKATADETLTLYDYDLNVTLAFILGIERRQNREEATAAIPVNLN